MAEAWSAGSVATPAGTSGRALIYGPPRTLDSTRTVQRDHRLDDRSPRAAGRPRPVTTFLARRLGARLDPKFVVTPTIRLLSNIAVRAVEEPDFRDIVTTPPRTGKSQLLAVWEVVWALMRNPDLQIVLVSYSDQTRPSAQPRGAAAHQRACQLPRVPVVVGQDGSVARLASRGWAACDRDQQRRHGFRSRPDGD